MSDPPAPTAEDKLRVLVEACQALSRNAPADAVMLHHDYNPPPEGMDEFEVREAIADVAYSAGEQAAAEGIRRALRSIRVDPADGEASPLAKSTVQLLAELGVVDEGGSPAAADVAPARRTRRAASAPAPRAIPANGLVSRAVLAEKLGISRERCSPADQRRQDHRGAQRHRPRQSARRVPTQRRSGQGAG